MHIHKFFPSDKKGYEVCECGTYHSIELASPKELYENEYWSEKNGHSEIQDQIWNVAGDKVNGFSKVDKMLSYLDKKGTLLEIGCFPGVLMRRAERMGNIVYGIEPDKKLIPEILIIGELRKHQVINGYFPNVELPIKKFDYIICMDIIEHIEDYDTFIKSIFNLLEDGGKFLMMSPIIKDGKYRDNDRDFCSHEHSWLFSYEYISQYLSSMFKMVYFDSWQLGHEIFISIK